MLVKCEDVKLKIEIYLDKEQTLSDRHDIEKHLADCKSCQSVLAGIQSLDESIQKIGYKKTPFSLQKNIKRGLKDISGESDSDVNRYQLFLFGAGGVVFASVIWIIMTVIFLQAETAQQKQKQFTEEIITAHVRSLLVDHLTDVATSDRHTVKPWFNGKLNFSPEIKDFEKNGFELIGGRLEYLDKQVVAALVYKKRLHIINLFVYSEGDENWQPTNDDVQRHVIQQQGYNMVGWAGNGLVYQLISDLNAKELKRFADLFSDEDKT